jgi:hypothetical protein
LLPSRLPSPLPALPSLSDPPSLLEWFNTSCGGSNHQLQSTACRDISAVASPATTGRIAVAWEKGCADAPSRRRCTAVPLGDLGKGRDGTIRYGARTWKPANHHPANLGRDKPAMSPGINSNPAPDKLPCSYVVRPRTCHSAARPCGAFVPGPAPSSRDRRPPCKNNTTAHGRLRAA